MRLTLQVISHLLLFSSSLLAFEDQDIDGVSDSYDLCPDTPFDDIVNTQGCAHNQKISGKFTFQIGSDISFEKLSDISNNLNLYVNYHYAQWDFSLSSTNNNFTNLNTTNTSENDLYFTVGHLFQYEQLNTKASLGTKFAFMDNDDIQRDNDYYASIHLDYYTSTTHNVFLYYNYTVSGQSTNTVYNDFASASLGTGYMFTPKWYSALSYNYSGSPYPGVKDYKALSWFNSYNFTKDLYITCNYAYTLNNSTAQHILSLNIGVHFE